MLKSHHFQMQIDVHRWTKKQAIGCVILHPAAEQSSDNLWLIFYCLLYTKFCTNKGAEKNAIQALITALPKSEGPNSEI